MQDITPDLLEAVERSFRDNLGKNKKIKTLQKALEDGKATYHEADQYAVEVGQELAKAFREHISSDTLPDGKMYYNIASRVIPPPLRASHEEIADFAETMQRGMNERANIEIKAVRPKYNGGKEKGLIEYAVQADQYDSIRRSFEEDLINFGQAVVTDALRENAEFQYGAGLSPVIRRTTNGGCCDWCSKLAGTYPYEDVRDTGNDVYRRHRSCRCRIVFDPGEGKVQNVHTKRWEEQTERTLRIPQIPASTITAKVISGRYSLKLGKQQYDKHIRGTKEYVRYEEARKKKGLGPQSRLTISYEEAQKIIENQSGTGIIKTRRDGTPTDIEWITCDKVIGQYFHKGNFYDTKKAMIIHGRRGSHIVPQKGNNYD